MKRKNAQSVILCLLLLMVFFTGCSKKASEQDVVNVELPNPQSEFVSLRSTVVYYANDEGYLVPVMKKLPNEDSIAVSALSMLVSTDINNEDAARLGLSTVLPKGTAINLSVSESLATVSLSEEALSCEDALGESNMVTAIVSTLTEFPTIETVQILIEGQNVSKLKFGTDVSEPIARTHINLESVDTIASLKGSDKITLYFESEQSKAIVPITRTVFSRNDVETAVLELLKGPKEGSGLKGIMPKGAGLIAVIRENGVVIINFTQQFKEVALSTDGGKQALKSLVLTCSQFPEVKEVKLQIEGQDFDLDAQTLATPTFINIDDSSLATFTDGTTELDYDFEVDVKVNEEEIVK